MCPSRGMSGLLLAHAVSILIWHPQQDIWHTGGDDWILVWQPYIDSNSSAVLEAVVMDSLSSAQMDCLAGQTDAQQGTA
jgi:hypothetical protein